MSVALSDSNAAFEIVCYFHDLEAQVSVKLLLAL